MARQAASGSSLASGTQLLSQNSSNAHYLCNMSVLNNDDCRCLCRGCSAIADKLTTYFGIGNFTLQISAPAYCALFPIARLRHATLQARGRSIKAQKCWGKPRCAQQLLGIFQGNSTSPASHDCLSRNGCLAGHWQRDGLCFLCLHGAMVKNTKARAWLKGRFHWEEDGVMV